MNVVQDFLKSKDVLSIMTPSYSPQFQPIELAFSKVKQHYKRSKAQATARNEKVVLNRLIDQSFVVLTKENIVNYIRRCKEILEEESRRVGGKD